MGGDVHCAGGEGESLCVVSWREGDQFWLYNVQAWVRECKGERERVGDSNYRVNMTLDLESRNRHPRKEKYQSYA